MSWDVIILKEKFEIDDNDYTPPPLGNRKDIIAALTKIFPNLDYTDPSWGLLKESDYSIEFNTGDEEIVATMMLHIRGGGNPLNAIKLILNELNWAALDCSTTEFIDLDMNDNESWIEFQKYRDKVMNSHKD